MILNNLTDLKGAPTAEAYVRDIAADIGRVHYDGNLRADTSAYGKTPKVRCRFVLRCHSSFGAGARKSASGRRLNSATWEVHKRVMRQIFSENPTAKIQSALATYDGAADFEEKHFATYHKNAGSMMEPASFGDL